MENQTLSKEQKRDYIRDYIAGNQLNKHTIIHELAAANQSPFIKYLMEIAMSFDCSPAETMCKLLNSWEVEDGKEGGNWVIVEKEKE